MLQVFICDDEKTFCTDLKEIVEVELDLKGIAYRVSEFSSGEELLTCFKGSPDQYILFLDIKMEGMDGMETARQIRAIDPSAVIIFVTCYSDFVFQGYQVRALNYILKPYNRYQIAEILETGLKILDAERQSYFFIRKKSGELLIPFQSIVCFKSKGHQILAVTPEATHSFYGKLRDLEETLPPCFVRIHSRYLINLRHLKALADNQVQVGAERFPVSRSCKQAFLAAYARYILE